MSLRFSIPITLRSLGRGFHIVPAEEAEREPSAELPPIDYAPLTNASRQVALWLLDVARSRTTDPLDQTAIDRVQRAFMHALATNAPACARPEVSEEDLLTVFGILLTAFETDLGLDGLGEVAASTYDAERDRSGGLVDQAMVARLVGAMTPKRGLVRQVVRIVPWSVGRRPCVVDEDTLADLYPNR